MRMRLGQMILVDQARAVELTPNCSQRTARSTLGIMDLCWGGAGVEHPVDEHDVEDHPIADLSGDPCRSEAGSLCIDALIAGLMDLATVEANTAALAEVCASGIPSHPACDDADPLPCITANIRKTAEVLRIPRR